MSSSNISEEVIRRSMTRVILPFSFSNYFMEKKTRFPKTGSGITAKFPSYASIVGNLEKSESWTRTLDTGKLKDLESVLITHVIRIFHEKEEDLPEVSVFSLDENRRKSLFGEFLFMLPSGTYRKRLKKDRCFVPEEGFFCLLSDIRLILGTTGIGMLQADFHLCDTGTGKTWPCDEAFRNRLLDFVSVCQYVPSGFRKGMAPKFVRHGSTVLFSGDPSLSVFQRNAFKEFLAEFGNVAVDATGAKKDAFFGHSELSETEEQAFDHLLREVKRQAGSLDNPFAGNGSGLSGFEDNIRNQIEKDQWQENRIKQEALKPLIEELRPKVREEWPGILAELPEWLNQKNHPGSLQEDQDALIWSYSNLVLSLFGDMGIELKHSDDPDGDAGLDPDEMRTIFLNGDRMFVFSHLFLDEGDKTESLKEFAVRLSRRHGLNHDLCGFDEKTFYAPYQTIDYAISLEGVAVLQERGKNPEFDKNTAVIRERHFTLVLISLLYRFNLLNFECQSVMPDIRKTRGQEIEAIDRLNTRVDHFTHHLYNSHVSNFTHLQELFDKLLERMNVHKLWEDAGRDVCQYLERRKQIREQHQDKRRKNIKILITLLGGLVITSDIANLLFHLKLRDKILESVDFNGELLLIPLLIFLALICVFGHWFIEGRDHTEEESAD